MSKSTIYIAGPITKPDPIVNVARAMAVFGTLLDYDYLPFLPHFCHFAHMQSPRHYEDWMEYDFGWVAKCDALLRLPGDSPGSDREVDCAKRNNKPVFLSIKDLLRGVPPPSAPKEPVDFDEIFARYPMLDV